MTQSVTAEPTGAKTMTPNELWDYNGPLYVENRSHTKIFHEDMQNKGVQLELGPVTSESRFGILPISIAKSPTFQKIWRQGMVRVSTDPEMEAVLTLSDHRQAMAEAARLQGVTDMIDTSQTDRAMEEITCLECGTKAFMTNADIVSGAAPLCVPHKHLSASWILEENFNEEKGEVEGNWAKVTVGATQAGLPEGPSRELGPRP